jgi:hypothetical protein
MDDPLLYRRALRRVLEVEGIAQNDLFSIQSLMQGEQKKRKNRRSAKNRSFSIPLLYGPTEQDERERIPKEYFEKRMRDDFLADVEELKNAIRNHPQPDDRHLNLVTGWANAVLSGLDTGLLWNAITAGGLIAAARAREGLATRLARFEQIRQAQSEGGSNSRRITHVYKRGDTCHKHEFTDAFVEILILEMRRKRRSNGRGWTFGAACREVAKSLTNATQGGAEGNMISEATVKLRAGGIRWKGEHREE